MGLIQTGEGGAVYLQALICFFFLGQKLSGRMCVRVHNPKSEEGIAHKGKVRIIHNSDFSARPVWLRV